MTTSAPESAPVYPQAPTGLRRPGIIAGVVTVAVVGASFWLGHPLVGVFFFVGVIGVFVNAVAVRNVVTVIAAEANPHKKSLALNSAARLGAITVLALAAAILVRPDGLGVMFGLAVGQVILVLNTVIPVMKGLRKQL
ncbi:hypothetical protein [Gordonia sp. (in: high G+C Gram-positive bacteria)]|jgi:hypothetical protein|uniref:hypothetical protein n=1 Tax=Gordonia sp. (in: high G+C Gram-positive bacteria) TaxID=84139 RepID=UPI001D36DCEC|nr:hypothetical protein [Gordonia sp. (in: high G+C Gram-positive bacteria)]MCB1295232.1 hypothetical protein [Gordonia sp. (in: high G+C Gram-positive bacteria)]HMS76847.1 hypothetical protein [Gordonia sp. (in: high G+C Gram-positive bacteria)]HQV18348.1 hypothetical protein [Gordonia sp. (in: high G+C Gram-positive bacteria)]